MFFLVFLSLLSTAVKDDSKRGHYRDKIKGYMDRAEQIKVHVNQMKEGTYHKHSKVDDQLEKNGQLSLKRVMSLQRVTKSATVLFNSTHIKVRNIYHINVVSPFMSVL